MKLPLETKPLTPITVEEFRASGMLFLANLLLQPFGMALAVQVEDGQVGNIYPARTAFRGFSETDQDEEHVKIANYLKDNSGDFLDEIK